MTTLAAPVAPLAHALTDLAGRFLSVDDRFCELVRRERADVLGLTILDLTAGTDRPLNAEKLDVLRERGTSFTIRKAYLCGDGSAQSVENIVSLLTDGTGGGKVVASVKPLALIADTRFTTSIRIARLLLNEHVVRAALPTTFQDADWRVLLAAYLLEVEGAPVWAHDLGRAVGGEQAAAFLRIWELVQAGVLVVDGDAASLEHTSVRLSLRHTKLLERHLAAIAIK